MVAREAAQLLIDFLQRECPSSLPRRRQEVVKADAAAPSVVPAAPEDASPPTLPGQVELARLQHR